MSLAPKAEAKKAGSANNDADETPKTTHLSSQSQLSTRNNCCSLIVAENVLTSKFSFVHHLVRRDITHPRSANEWKPNKRQSTFTIHDSHYPSRTKTRRENHNTR